MADASSGHRPLALPPRPHILVVALRRLGDVLLATPLIRSMRRTWPQAHIDVLAFADTRGILDGNPDINGVVTMPSRPTHMQTLTLAARIFKRYDLAVSTQSGDRPTLFALLAGRVHAGLIGPDNWIKRHLLYRAVPIVAGEHRVVDMLRLADALGVSRVAEVVCPVGIPRTAIAQPYAVIHAAPMFRYKQWTPAGWRALAEALRKHGLDVVASGGPSDRAYLDEVWHNVTGVHRVDGRLSWAEIAWLLSRARVYVGPDTSVTHLAAASGCPVVAIFGPTDPRIWGPWPFDGLKEPWRAADAIQRRGNVWLVQNVLPCTPCQKEGCDRHVASHSQCLDELSPRQVLMAVDQALSDRAADRKIL